MKTLVLMNPRRRSFTMIQLGRPLGQTVTAEDIELVTTVLQEVMDTTQNIACAVYARPVGFVRINAEELGQAAEAHAHELAERLATNTRLRVTRQGTTVQFWPAELSSVVQLYRVRQVAPHEQFLGMVYAVSGYDARDLVAADAGYADREPGTVIEVMGRQVPVAGRPRLNAYGSYQRACRAVVSGHIGTTQDWRSEPQEGAT